MKILVTGAFGFIGTHLSKKLKELGHDVFEFGRDYCISDIQIMHFDSIINLAASIHNKSTILYDNVGLTTTLLQDMHYDKFIQVGSSSEYEITNGVMTEETPLAYHSLYSATKIASSMVSLAYGKTQPNKSITVARPFSVYGPGDKETKFMQTVVRNIRSNIPVTAFPGNHDWIHVDDFCNGLILLLNSNKINEVYNFCSGISYNNIQVIEILSKLMNKKVNIITIPEKYREYDRDLWVGSYNKAKTDLGWEPIINFEDGLRTCI